MTWWWSLLETCSNLFIWGSTPLPGDIWWWLLKLEARTVSKRAVHIITSYWNAFLFPILFISTLYRPSVSWQIYRKVCIAWITTAEEHLVFSSAADQKSMSLSWRKDNKNVVQESYFNNSIFVIYLGKASKYFRLITSITIVLYIGIYRHLLYQMTKKTCSLSLLEWFIPVQNIWYFGGLDLFVKRLFSHF